MKRSYLEVIYPQEEYAEHLYPQKLCDYLSENYFYELEDGGVERLDGHEEYDKVFGGKLLDIGSGKGNHLIGFYRCGYEAFGLDKRKECVEVLNDFDIRECDIETDVFPYEDNFFSWIFSKSVLEHVSNTDNFMNESLRVLKPGGKVVFMCPAWESQYKLYWDDYTHVKPYTRKSLQNAMRMAGFSDVEVSYFLQLPFIWKRPYLEVITKVIALLPDSLKWKNKEQSDARKLIRFSKEKMLFAVGGK